ncbi:MAG: sigma 54-interacting transcriptional regulator [Flavobacteriaceae bacterium]
MSFSERGGIIRIAIAGGDPVFARRLAEKLPQLLDGQASVKALDTAADLLKAGSIGAVDIALVDLSLDDKTLTVIGEAAQTIPCVIALSDGGSVRQAVAAMRRGAADFLIKPIAFDHLADRIIAANEKRVATPRPATREAERDEADFEGFIGRSAAMAGVYRQIGRIAPARGPVFITGESGTGKEVCASAIHARSNNSGGPLIAINCAAIPRDLIESELFGHVRGAFTGAGDDRPGAAELADGGTLFLDEICEMDLALQTKLLRFVQTGSFRRLGDTRERSVDVRLVAATNRDPLREIQLGNFREDLYYRLHVLPIHLPPLRMRQEDIMPLAEAFLDRYAAAENRSFVRFAADAAEALTEFAWPGNVRQLENVIQRIVVLNDGDTITADMLPASIPGAPMATGEAGPATLEPAGGMEPLWQQEKRIIEQAILRFGGNIAKAAAALEVSPSTIYRKRLGWQHA